MKIKLEPGRYVVAVSGGVDSVTLLHLLTSQPGLELVVAHFDHGIREDSIKDRKLVEQLANHYDLPFVYDEGKLGKVSEATAREARYAFLDRVVKQQKARGIITAHHQDDVIETAIINILRGTGRKGLSSLSSNEQVVRPLLNIPKSDILAYAKDNNLQWHEDSTNKDDQYLRNYVRHNIVPKLDAPARQTFLAHLQDAQLTNQTLDALLVKHTAPQVEALDRQWFTKLPHAVAKEFLAAWLRAHGIRDFDTPTLERLVVVAKTGRVGSSHDVRQGMVLQLKKDQVVLAGTQGGGALAKK